MKTMLVRLIFDAQFCGHEEITVRMPINKDSDYIKAVLFPQVMGLAFDENCGYEILEDDTDG